MHHAIAQHITLLNDTTEKSIHNIKAVSQDILEEMEYDKPPMQQPYNGSTTSENQNIPAKQHQCDKWGPTSTTPNRPQ
jgi:hypothetical protein